MVVQHKGLKTHQAAAVCQPRSRTICIDIRYDPSEPPSELFAFFQMKRLVER